MDLGAQQDQPVYRAMKTFIDANEPTTTIQNPQLRLDLQHLDLPHYSLQLAKAAEFLYHNVDGAAVISCLPKILKSYLGRSNEKIVYNSAIRAHTKKMSANVIKRCHDVTKIVVLATIDDAGFRAAIAKGHHSAVRFFKTLVTPDISYHVLSEQWKAVDFRFVHHEGVRASAEEETIRQDLRRIYHPATRRPSNPETSTGKRSKNEAAGRANQTQDKAAGMTIIKENYKRYTSWGPTAKVARVFGKLPATPDFESRNNIVKPKALVSANEEKRNLDDTGDEEDGGIIGRRQRAGNDC
ncbi:hypothetical protein V496_06213 [Pseudogymnoascus sp. VKM F-4515 (FW-2607)]|nr:hypothetical protein V496_06213 [Pseudogymnoascus sp. VKM F-4515 (FW-2607)]KFY94225.1 hypothetical protein V498_03967 [Pseudogymnoascus sp. VKM F-4517 (FW-2822)]